MTAITRHGRDKHGNMERTSRCRSIYFGHNKKSKRIAIGNCYLMLVLKTKIIVPKIEPSAQTVYIATKLARALLTLLTQLNDLNASGARKSSIAFVCWGEVCIHRR